MLRRLRRFFAGLAVNKDIQAFWRLYDRGYLTDHYGWVPPMPTFRWWQWRQKRSARKAAEKMAWGIKRASENVLWYLGDEVNLSNVNYYNWKETWEQ